jgi:hypothetical protein
MVAKGDRVWFRDCAKEHPAIVAAVSGDGLRAVVICGTENSWSNSGSPSEAIDAAPGNVARLVKKTYFYQDRVHDCAVTELRQHQPKARCPNAKWERIYRLAVAGARERFDRQMFDRWWPDENKAETTGPQINGRAST